MSELNDTELSFDQPRRHALCIGISEYTALEEPDLRFAASDARAIAEALSDPRRGNFKVNLRVTPEETTGVGLRQAIKDFLKTFALNEEDQLIIYLSGQGIFFGKDKSFFLLASDTRLQANGVPDKATILTGQELAALLNEAHTENITVFLDIYQRGTPTRGLPRTFEIEAGGETFLLGAVRQGSRNEQPGKLKHSVFTHALLQAFEQKPTRPDSWISLSQIQNFVADALEGFGVTLLASKVSPANPNLPVIQNPLYSPQSLSFNKQIKELLHMAGYKPLNLPLPQNAPPLFYVTEIKVGFETDRVGIISYYDIIQPLSPQFVEKVVSFVKDQIEEGELDKAMLVTVNEPSREVRRVLRNSNVRYPTIMTLNQLTQKLIDFELYLRKQVDSYSNPELIPDRIDDPPLAQVYIPLNTRYLGNSEGTSSDWFGSLERAVTGWLNGSPSSRLALLADYGSGKTAFCRHLTAQLAKQYLEAPEHSRLNFRIPLLIPLRDFVQQSRTLEGYLISYLKQECEVENPNYRALLKMAQEGLILFIFDGFDEMAVRADTDTIHRNIAMIEGQASISRNKVIITTRPEYFVSWKEQEEVLKNYEQLEIQPFNEQQVDQFLQKRVPLLKIPRNQPRRDWTYYQQRIRDIYDLSDLKRRPVLLEMIVKTLPQLTNKTEAINRPNLYQYYLDGELSRQIIEKRRNLLIKREKRFEIMERLALEIYRSEETRVLTMAQINEISRELLTPEQQTEMAAHQREILACSFLNRLGDRYLFSHESFYEYLVARRLAKELTDGNPENLRLKVLTRTIREFLVEMSQIPASKTHTSNGNDQNTVYLETRDLSGWLIGHSKDRWLSSNLASLLAGLTPRFSFARMNFAGADFSKASLCRADFSRANLTNVDLTGADLSEANLSEANLNGAKLVGAVMTKTNFYGADLRETNFTGADLSEATLSSARLHTARLRDARLSRAILFEADLKDADLSGADLYEADLRKVKNMPPRFRKQGHN